jgi:hypothetical protein
MLVTQLLVLGDLFARTSHQISSYSYSVRRGEAVLSETVLVLDGCSHRSGHLAPTWQQTIRVTGRSHLSPDGGGFSNPAAADAWHRISKNRGNEGLRLRIDEPAPWFSTDPAIYNRKKK